MNRKFSNLISLVLTFIMIVSAATVCQASEGTDYYEAEPEFEEALSNELRLSNEECNDIARWLLDTYYAPEDFVDTGLWNIRNGFDPEKYSHQEQLEEIYALTDEITANFTTDEEKIRAVHDWICKNIKYNYSPTTYTGYPYEDDANPFTVFLNKTGVCYGYANLTQLMLQHAGIPCLVVRGYLSSPIYVASHVWNVVYVNGSWLFSDNTQDAAYTEEAVSYRYYLMDDETFDNNYRTDFLEDWSGDACYTQVRSDPQYVYHEITLNANGGKCIRTIPFTEGSKYLLLPIPVKEGYEFAGWENDRGRLIYPYSKTDNITKYYIYKPEEVTYDIACTAIYKSLNPATPTPKPTKTPTPKPTKAPTPKPTKTPTPKPTKAPVPTGKLFDDVKDPTHPYYKAIYWAVDHGVTKGYSGTNLFGINDSCTRSQAMMFIWRMAGKPEPYSWVRNPFSDINTSHPHFKAVMWAYQNGVAKGFSNGTYGTDKPCTRGQIMTFIWRYAGRQNPKSNVNPFRDKLTPAYRTAILWGNELRITHGYSDGTFRDMAPCTRGQIVTFLYRIRNWAYKGK